jgi:spore germination protein YaaH
MKTRFLVFCIFLLITALLVRYWRVSFISHPKLPSAQPQKQLLFLGTLSYFEVESGMSSFTNNVKQLNLIAPFWYQLESDGTVTRDKTISTDVETTIIQFSHAQNKKILLGLLNYGNADRVRKFLYDKRLQKQNIRNIMNMLNEKTFDGVDIDYEGLSDADSSAFTSYIVDLTTAAHDAGKSVSVSTIVEAKGQVFGGINIVEISKIVDRLDMQTYSEHGEYTNPGSIAGINWVESIIKNAITKGVSPDKIILGTVDAAHDWIVSPKLSFYSVTTTREALANLKKANARFEWINTDKNTIAYYTDDKGSKHEVWIEDVKSFQEKQKLARKYGLQGIFLWFLGGEEPDFWQSIKH